MNINITISSDSSESRSIHLLTEVVECLQSEKTELNKKYLTLKREKVDVVKQLKEHPNFETEKKKLKDKLTEKEKEFEDAKKKLEDRLSILQSKYQTLEDEKVSVEKSYEKLQKQQDEAKTRMLIESIKQLSQVLEYSLNTSLSPKWSEYLGGIKSDIDKFITEEQTISDITLKIVSKNGWLAKLTSIRWWSKAISVKNDLPASLQEGSGFYVSFCNLQHLLKENGVDILIPTCDFSGNIDNYKVDYDEVTIIKDLFPAYIPKSYVLCEINYVSYNGNIGKCIGYKS